MVREAPTLNSSLTKKLLSHAPPALLYPLVGTVIANPLGDDQDDFPSGSYLEEMEDECLAVGAAVEAFHPANMMRQKPKTQ